MESFTIAIYIRAEQIPMERAISKIAGDRQQKLRGSEASVSRLPNRASIA
jgi:hypothetical protein